ncbi:MAG TPA: hypothetical protein VKS19_09835 [Verrucomicrobiae bacterium]|nr:hypothetical protein [Verrucomicrobiae bacterium]
MSRNALAKFIQALYRLMAIGTLGFACPQVQAADLSLRQSGGARAHVLIVENSNATYQYQPNTACVQDMVNRGITNFTGKPTVAEAWRSLVSPQDIVGIKVFSAAGPINGTRPAVVAAVIHGLLAAGLPPGHVIIWDRDDGDLRAAGFFKLAARLGVRAAGSTQAGYDPTNFYLPDTPIIGQLVWGDFEFGRKGPEVGKKSFVSLLVSRQITKIISIAPLLNQDAVGVCGHLYGLAMGSVDNTRRFQGDSERLAVAVPEIYALPALGDRVALNITDALIGQYAGGARGLLQYSTVLNQLWFSRDPVALDTLAIRELDRERLIIQAPGFKPNPELYSNAALLQLGMNESNRIQVEKLH